MLILKTFSLFVVTAWDLTGALVTVAGMAIIVWGGWQ